MVTSPPPQRRLLDEAIPSGHAREGPFQETSCNIHLMEQERAQSSTTSLAVVWTWNVQWTSRCPSSYLEPAAILTFHRRRYGPRKPEPRTPVPVDVESSDNERLFAGQSKRSRSGRLLRPACSSYTIVSLASTLGMG